MDKNKLKALKEILLKEQLDDAINRSLKIQNDLEKAYDKVNSKIKIKK